MIVIASDVLAATIDPFGAELVSLRGPDGREYMSDGDPAYWTGRAPLLFPIVGALGGGVYRHDGREFALPQHGFARRMGFAVVEAAEDRAVFRLTDSAATRAVYPFAFVLDMAFVLEGATLTMTASVTNSGDGGMPASFGFHPAFARLADRIVFERDEPTAIRALDGGLIAGERASPLDGRTLMLGDALFADGALVWTAIESARVQFGALDIAFPVAPMLGIWSQPGAGFVCVEPWWGHADPVGFAGEIWDKPGMMRFAPGERREFAMAVGLNP